MEKAGGKIFSELLKDLGVGPSEFSILMGYTQRPDKGITTKVSQWQKRGLPVHEHRHVCKKLEEKGIGKLNPDWLADGVGTRWLNRYRGSSMIKDVIPADQVVSIRCFDAGRTDAPEQLAQCTIKELIIHEDWLQRNLRVTSANSIAIREMRGDSMHPTIKDGEIMFIDVSANRIDRDGIYMVTVDDDLYVKHVLRIPGKLKFSNTAPSKSSTFEIRKAEFDRVHVLGRVVGSWAIRKLG